MGKRRPVMFVPKESDKQWMKTTFDLLNIGGIWGTSWATYKKTDENTLVVTLRNPTIKSEDVEDNINRVRIVMELIGKKLVDKNEK